jgi:prepilin-type N-terminal cleavage/methylation domain-containing protein
MINPLKLLLNKQLKLFKLVQKSGGFTLIELLVAIAISFIILATLLAFLTNILNSERREQAKATTELEIQSAIDYIADDLQEAVYIYDADGITAIKSQLPEPAATDQVPVLVFWKRTFFSKESQVVLANGTTTRVGCLGKISDTNDCDEKDYFGYSIVSYYLIKDNNSEQINAARIGRMEIKDGIRDPNNSSNYLTNPAPGFRLFDLTGSGSLKDKMNAWKKDVSSPYDPRITQIETLVDYVDRSTGKQIPLPENCTTISPNAQLVPATNTIENSLNTYSFYACVDSAKNFAQVYLRGNALARMNQEAMYSENRSEYFPIANVQVKSQVNLIN